MSQVNLAKLAGQGRAYDATRPWSEEELSIWLEIQQERGLNQINAAEYVRQGVRTLDEFDKMQKKGLEPSDVVEAKSKASSKAGEEALKGVRKSTKTKKTSKKKDD